MTRLPGCHHSKSVMVCKHSSWRKPDSPFIKHTLTGWLVFFALYSYHGSINVGQVSSAIGFDWLWNKYVNTSPFLCYCSRTWSAPPKLYATCWARRCRGSAYIHIKIRPTQWKTNKQAIKCSLSCPFQLGFVIFDFLAGLFPLPKWFKRSSEIILMECFLCQFSWNYIIMVLEFCWDHG